MVMTLGLAMLIFSVCSSIFLLSASFALFLKTWRDVGKVEDMAYKIAEREEYNLNIGNQFGGKDGN